MADFTAALRYHRPFGHAAYYGLNLIIVLCPSPSALCLLHRTSRAICSTMRHFHRRQHVLRLARMAAGPNGYGDACFAVSTDVEGVEAAGPNGYGEFPFEASTDVVAGQAAGPNGYGEECMSSPRLAYPLGLFACHLGHFVSKLCGAAGPNG